MIEMCELLKKMVSVVYPIRTPRSNDSNISDLSSRYYSTMFFRNIRHLIQEIESKFSSFVISFFDFINCFVYPLNYYFTSSITYSGFWIILVT